MTVIDNSGINTSNLSGVELAKYVLLRLTNDHDSIEKVAEDFDNNKTFILGVINFLNEVGWIKQVSVGVYRMTNKGKNNTITHHKQTVNFHK